ncbi:MAG TPA: urease accessory protein UreD [Dongiaceae bacterium]|nr:urease accessory protein UreD [Dongiaceae bacterium]
MLHVAAPIVLDRGHGQSAGPALSVVRPQRGALQRSTGHLHISVDRGPDGHTLLRRLGQSGSARLLFPRAAGGLREAVVVNTSGGLAGGDRFDVEAEVGAGARLTLTSQAAEKIYRALDIPARMETRLRLDRGASLDWIPQEAILFHQARLTRRLEVEMQADASLLVAESVVFGRTERGETVRDGHFADLWRVRRGGKLIFAEQSLFSGDIAAQLAKPGVAQGAAAICAVLYVAPEAEARADEMRAAMQEAAGAQSVAQGGISAWNGMLALRFVAEDGFMLKRRLAALLRRLRGADNPSVWQF